MKKCLTLLFLLALILIIPGCKREKSIYDDAYIYECQEYYSIKKGSRIDYLNPTTDELGNYNSGFRYYRLVFYENYTFALVYYAYVDKAENIYYGRFEQTTEPTTTPAVDSNGNTILDDDGNIVYVKNSIITLYYDDVSFSWELINGNEKYVVSNNRNQLTRSQTIWQPEQEQINQTWKLVDKRDLN